MASIEVPIHPDRAGSIRAALDPNATTVVIDLDAIGQDERDLLADHDGSTVVVTVPTQAAVLAALRTRAEEERAQLDEILTAYRDALNQRRTHSWRSQTREGGVTYEVVEPDWPNRPGWGSRDRGSLLAKYRDQIREITDGEEARTWAAELEARNRQARDHAWTRQRMLDEAEEHQRAEAIGRLREWALAQGSERVRLLIEEDIDAWYAIAEDEYFTQHTPDGFAPLTREVVRGLPTPEAADIHALRETRRLASDDALDEPRLAWIAAVTSTGQQEASSAVALTITGPHGAQRTVWRAVPDPPSAEATGADQ